MTGKQPGFYFYPNDWARDMEEYPLEIQGAWITILCKLWWSETRGKATKNLTEWARILREKKKKTEKILHFLFKKHIADISGLDNQNPNQNITIISRRMVRDHEISQLRQQVGKMGGNPKLTKPETFLDNQKPNQKGLSPIPYPIPYPFPKEKKENTIAETQKKSSPPHYKSFLIFYNSYPIKTGKKPAWERWEKLKKENQLPEIAIILDAIKKQKAWRDNANGEFRPEWKHPATWLNKGCWEDEVTSNIPEEEDFIV